MIRTSGAALHLETFRENIHRISERVQELRYGIRTADYISEESLGYIKGDGRLDYTPLPYSVLKKLLSAVVPDPRRDVFIDWGAGQGRVLVLASTYAYCEVIGVEYSSPLCASAQRNLMQNRVRRRCGRVRVVNSDARDFPIPDNSSVMFFYNPFRGELLTEVVRHIRDSWIAHPRPITFLVANHINFIEDTESADWLSYVDCRSEYPPHMTRYLRSSCVIQSLESPIGG